MFTSSDDQSACSVTSDCEPSAYVARARTETTPLPEMVTVRGVSSMAEMAAAVTVTGALTER